MPHRARGLWGPLILCLVIAAVAGATVGPDADWDLRNYHLYNGIALLRGRVGYDLAPAQLQSFLTPGLDVIYVLVLGALNRHPAALNAVLALPQGLAAFLAWCLARRMLPEEAPSRGVLAAIVTAMAASGAAGVSTLATAMSEMIPTCCLLAALLSIQGARLGQGRSYALAGLLTGFATGLKLTVVPCAVGLTVSVLIVAGRRGRAKALGWFAVAALSGAALAGGPWWLYLWTHFGDPLFPYFNDIFRSPWAAPGPHTDTRFLPHDWLQAIVFPVEWALLRGRWGGELDVRDPRILIGLIAAALVLVRAARQRRWPEPAIRALLATWIIGYALWEARFSILRYLSALELMVAPLLAAALAPYLARCPARRSLPALAAMAALVAAWTVYPDWGRASPASRAVMVRPPHFPPGSLVVLLDPSPMAYVAAFAPASVRFVGADNNLVHPGAPDRLARRVASAIRDHSGPLWGLEEPRENPGVADRTLRAYGLVRAPGCIRVRSNLDHNAILACPLRRRQ